MFILHRLKISENIEIEHVLQSKAFFHVSGNLHTSCFSAFKRFHLRDQILATNTMTNNCLIYVMQRGFSIIPNFRMNFYLKRIYNNGKLVLSN